MSMYIIRIPALLAALCIAGNLLADDMRTINAFGDVFASSISPLTGDMYFSRDDNSSGHSVLYSSHMSTSGWTAPSAVFPAGNVSGRVIGILGDGTLGILGSNKVHGFGISLIGNGGRTQQIRIDGFGWGRDILRHPSTNNRPASLRFNAYMSLSGDGKTLIISDYGEFGSDLYVSYLTNGVFSAPRSLGPAVNSEAEEISPFLSYDGQTLYFASDRAGNFDIFMCRRLDARWRWVSPPQPISAVNTALDEAYFSTDPKGEYAYVTRYNEAQKGSIVRVPMDAVQDLHRPQAAGQNSLPYTAGFRTPVSYSPDAELKHLFDAAMERVRSANEKLGHLERSMGKRQ